MKRLLIIILFVTCVSVRYAGAGVVGAADASASAAKFFGTAPGVPVMSDAERTKSALAEPEFYVFNNPSGGWVIIAADDAVLPVIAYSRKGAFRSDGMPSNLRYWLEGKKEEIRFARKSGAVASEAVREAWNAIGEPAESAGKEKYLETATWSQDEPYNFYCPSITEGGRSVKTLTGCVATAMAIVLRFHEYPDKGTGTLSGYSYVSDKDRKTVNIEAVDLSSHSYTYSSMPLSDVDVRNASAARQREVARLIYDMGVSVQSFYNKSTGTGAFAQRIPAALSGHFGYGADCAYRTRSSCGPGEWIKMLKEEIEAGRPVLYGAAGENGHEFVISGYDADDLFYVNWGWGGLDNGYYCIKNFEGAEVTYEYNHAAIIGLAPDPGGKAVREDVITFEPTEDNPGISVNGAIERGTPFMLDAQYFYNWSEYKYDGSLRAVLLDRRDSVKCNISDEMAFSLDGCFSDGGNYRGISSCSCLIDDDIAFGDGIGFTYRTNLGNWKLVGYTRGESLGRMGAYDACIIKLPESLSAGDVLPFEIMAGRKPISRVDWYYDDTPVGSEQVTLVVGAHSLKAVITFMDSTNETLVQELIVK